MGASDYQLLCRFRQQADQEALAILVRRRIGQVYAAARRQVRDPQLAEDVTQAVFILFSRRASRIKDEAGVLRWLMVATRYASSNARRIRTRRVHHERRAAASKSPSTDSPPSPDSALLDVLDDALADLPSRDRDGVLLSYFHDKSFAEVGQAMGISEGAARQRVRRAIARMRAFFVERGLAADEAAVGAALSSAAGISVPLGLADSTLNLLTLASAAPATSGVVAGIVSGVNRMWMLAKIKLAAAAVTATAVAGVVTAQVATQKPAAPQPVVVEKEPIYAAAAGDDRILRMDGEVEVEVMGIASMNGNAGWWTTDGVKLDTHPDDAFDAHFQLDPPPTAQAVIRVKAAPDADVRVEIPQSMSSSGTEREVVEGSGEHLYLRCFSLREGVQQADLEITIADGPYHKVVERADPAPDAQAIHGTTDGGVVFYPWVRGDNDTTIYVATELKDLQWRLVYVDDAGEHPVNAAESGVGGKISSGCFKIPIAAERIRAVAIEARPFAKKAIAKNITLNPAKPTASRLEIAK